MPSEAERLQRAVGARVRQLRTAHGRMSQERLAFQAGFDPSFVGRLERGETGVTVATLAAICKVLDLTLGEFFESFDRPFGMQGPRRRRRRT